MDQQTVETPTASPGFLDLDEIQREMDNVYISEQRTISEIQQVMNMPLSIENIGLLEFCGHTNGELSIFSGVLDPPINSSQLLIFVKERNVHTALLFSENPLIPYIRGGTIEIRIRNDSGKLMDLGLIIDQHNGDYGLLTYVPFTTGKKIYGFYKKANCTRNHKEVKQFFVLGDCKEKDPIAAIQCPPMEARSVDIDLTDNDRIMSANCSPRFRKMAESWTYLGEALSDLSGLMVKTIDPNYIEKIMILNNQICYPPFTNG